MAVSNSSELQKAVDKLLLKEPRWKEAITPAAPGGLPGATSTGRPASGTSTSGGVLDEKDAAAREYYAARPMVSSDGVFTILWQPLKSLLLEDGSRARFKEPPA